MTSIYKVKGYVNTGLLVERKDDNVIIHTNSLDKVKRNYI